MIPVAKDWNPKQKALKSFLSNNDEKEAVALCLQMHSQLHDSQLTFIANSYQDMLIDDLSEMCFRHMPFDSFSSIAWNLWHITRIEDAVCNILIADESQIFSNTLKKEWELP